MGETKNGEPELIRISLIDYDTDEVLVDRFVNPDVPLKHPNTKYSGVTWKDINDARANSTILKGKAGARDAVWKFVGPGTLVIGHGVNNDLRSLRWIHLNVVDSCVIEAQRTKMGEAKEAATKQAEEAIKKAKEEKEQAERLTQGLMIEDKTDTVAGSQPAAPKPKTLKGAGPNSLKTLAIKYLGRDIQNKGKKGHDSLEDAVAARDVVDWNVCQLQKAWEAQGQPVLDVKGFKQLVEAGLLQ